MIDISLLMTIERLNKHTDKLHKIIAGNVIRYRKLKGYTQLQLALDIGLTGNAFIARAEKGINNNHFNIDHLSKISKVLDVPICEFFKDADEPKKKKK